MEIEMARCECCGLKEDCTQDYISEVAAMFGGKWLCGLCSEAVRDEASRAADNNNRNSSRRKKEEEEEEMSLAEAVKAHMSFCRKYKSNPATCVADGIRLMLRRRSGDLSSSSSSSSSTATTASSSAADKKLGRINN